MDFALHCLRSKAFGQKAAGGHLRRFEAVHAAHRQAEIRALVGRLTKLRFGKRRKRRRGRKSGCFHDDAAEAVVEHAGEEFRGFKIGELLLPRLHQAENSFLIKRQQLKMQHLPFSAEGDRPGEIEARGSGDSGFGELNLSAAARQNMTVACQRQRGLNPDPFQRTGILGIREDPGQRRIQRRAPVPEGFPEAVSVGHTAELRAGRASAGKNHCLCMHLFRSAAQGISTSVGLYFLHGEGAAQLNPCAVQPEAQNIEHTVGGIRHGIDPAVRLRGGQEAEMGEKALRIDRAEVSERIGGKRGIRAEIVSRTRVPVGEIATAVPSGEKLPADPLLPLQQQDVPARDF